MFFKKKLGLSPDCGIYTVFLATDAMYNYHKRGLEINTNTWEVLEHVVEIKKKIMGKKIQSSLFIITSKAHDD